MFKKNYQQIVVRIIEFQSEETVMRQVVSRALARVRPVSLDEQDLVLSALHLTCFLFPLRFRSNT